MPSEIFHTTAQFHAYGRSHLAVMALFSAAAVAMIVYGSWHRRKGGQTPDLAKVLSLLIVLVELPLQFYSMVGDQWRVDESLPFHLCDLAWMVAVYALWTRAAWAFGLLYYWGLTLTIQAIVTPHLEQDFPHWQFLLYFTGHCLVVLSAIYLTAVIRMRPTWRNYTTTIAVTVGWGVLMLAFNSLAGTNYLYVNGKPPTASAFDLLGPWPWYLGVALALGCTVWAAITVPWYWGPWSWGQESAVTSDPPISQMA